MDWRTVLYPLGFISSLAFGSRFLLQWLSSEIEQKSIVSRRFWIISLVGNCTLLIHSIIQQQYHVCFVQTCNAVISWRNINLMSTPEARYKKSTTAAILVGAITLSTLFFAGQNYVLGEPNIIWFRVPELPWKTPTHQTVPWFIHGVGFIGICLFSSRFWVQWWYAEKHQFSHLGKPFWYLSLTGTLLSSSYFFYILDPVNFIGPALGTIPYIRNILLIKKSGQLIHESTD
ncbi:MAG: lipid-A-disaccharide synthase N-terminal domain-containing protein [Chlamydiota bacterium]|nr:lipid-A-disaccharide synthase N-terminal domain-containing protein [Chlamydiota bacterium]